MENDFIEIEEGDALLTGIRTDILEKVDDPEKEKKFKTQVKNEEVEEFDTDEYQNDDPEPPITKTVNKDGEEEEDKNNDPEKVEYNNEFSAFAGELYNKNFFPDLDEKELAKIEDPDDLADNLAKQLNITFSQWQDVYKQNLVENLVKEGYIKKENITNLPQTYTEDQIKSSADVAKEVIRKYYKRTGVPDREIQRIIDTRDDLEESAIELNKLNTDLDREEQKKIADKIKSDEEISAKQRDAFAATLRENTFKYEEFIPGRKLKAKDKEEVLMNIENTLKKINSNLPVYAPLLSYLDKYGLLDGKFDKILKERNTESVNKLGQILQEKKRIEGGGNPQRRKTGIIEVDDTSIPQIYRK